MPRIYVSVNDFINYPVALAFAGRIIQLQAIAGGLDRLLAGASKRVDGFARKKVIAPGSTTIATGGIAQGSTTLPVTSTLGFGNGQEEAVVIGVGLASQEIVPIQPGGVQITSWVASPYPGNIILAQPTVNAHSAGETVQGCYQEVSTVGSSSSSDVFSDSLLQINQAAQIAAAHAPQFELSNLIRVIFLKQYPITKLYQLEHMLPIDGGYEPLGLTGVGIHPSAGYLRLPIGSFVLPEGLFRSTYTAGYQYVPDDIARATSLYAADELQNIQSQGAYEMSQGKLRAKYGDPKTTKSRFVQQAEEILEPYVRHT